ncbi:D-glycero-beta-D-manno-heptose 1,7-bisphosphate 7-phosphatase [Helicobacter jaachi]|uniref:D,D-heptose 1,7-bisphosphate phosphatase n=1 Tax=Helicobacter jaachi TaxID=1677920 RepID=A0A4U8T8U3_9HELI|nr:D-glycero-beta-D-manno-heptose 1,7-bisphosphate 7-phosphatase [Helicobacter jaachi]TLD96156.1 D-glycero-beta-D-manno-heptose 1,7-bisphosphate 7-phosphatase [Helicobacter jaachi]
MKCAFFDRDGVINKDLGYVYRIEDFVFCDGLFELLQTLKAQDYLLLVITNQSGIARGLYTESHLHTLHTYMQQCLQDKLGFNFDRIYFCPHAPEAHCECRKPNIGMIKQACKDFEIDLSRSFFVGDKITDMQCAQNANINEKFFLSNTNLADNSLKNVQNITTLRQLHSIIKAHQTQS